MTESGDNSRSMRFVTSLLYFCFFCSGAAGLIYSVLWEKALANYMGATSWVQALILSLFMLGLAAGSAVFGRIADRVQQHLQLYARLEMAVAVLAFVEVLTLHPAFEALGALGRDAAWSALTHKLLQAALAAVFILPLTFMMGGTLPILGRARVVAGALRERHLAFLYFINSLGASLGAFATGYLLIPFLGLDLTLTQGVLLNLVAGGFALLIHAWLRKNPLPDAAPEQIAATRPIPQTPFPWRLGLLLAGLGGYLSFVLEMAWIRMLSNVLGASTYSFTVMVGTFIFGIAAGSLLANRLYRRVPYWQILFAAQVLLLVGMIAMLPLYERLPYAFLYLRSLLARSPQAFWLYEASKFLICFSIMIVPTMGLGAFLPTLTSAMPESGGGWGRRIGIVYAVNTLGTVLGATSAGLVLLPAFGFDLLTRLVIVGETVQLLLLIAGFGFLARGMRLRMAGIGALVLVLLAFTPMLDPRHFTLRLFRGDPQEMMARDHEEIVRNRLMHHFHDDPAATIAVFDDTIHDVRTIATGGKPDGSTHYRDAFTQYLVGLMGNFLLEEPRRTALIGLGTGMSAAAILRNQQVEELVVTEIAHSVATPQVQDWFKQWNDNVLEDERLTLVVDDARSYFERNSERFDLIVSEPSNPWIAGIGNIFTREFFELAYDQLEDDGMYILWVQLYEMNPRLTNSIIHTFSQVFPHYSVWIFSARGSNLGILGTKRPLTVDYGALERRMADPAYRDILEYIRVTNPLTFLLLQLSDGRYANRIVAGSDLNTRTYPFVEYNAPKSLFVGKTDLIDRFDLRVNRAGLGHLLLGGYVAQEHVTQPMLIRTIEETGDWKSYDPVRTALIAWGQTQWPDREPLERLSYAYGLHDARTLAQTWQDWPEARQTKRAWRELLQHMIRSAEAGASGIGCPDLAPLRAELRDYRANHGLPERELLRDLLELHNRCGELEPWAALMRELGAAH